MKKISYNNELNKFKKNILKDLSRFKPYIYHVSKYNSIYIKFENEKLRSIRLADHVGREKYKYKWNLTIIGSKKDVIDNGVKRFYYPIGEYSEFIKHFENYANKVLKG